MTKEKVGLTIIGTADENTRTNLPEKIMKYAHKTELKDRET